MWMRISLKARSVLVGVFILIAYGVLVSTLTESRVAVMVADVFSGIAVISIAVLMFPLFREIKGTMPLFYLLLKFVEGLLMVAGGILYLNTQSQHFRELIYEGIHLYAFIVSGFLFYILLDHLRLVPRFICFWGMAGIGTLTVSTVLKLVGLPTVIIDYFLVLIITNEIFLAVWLFVKGLNVIPDRKK